MPSVSAASYLAGSSDVISGRRNAAAGTKIQIRTRSVDTSN